MTDLEQTLNEPLVFLEEKNVRVLQLQRNKKGNGFQEIMQINSHFGEVRPFSTSTFCSVVVLRSKKQPQAAHSEIMHAPRRNTVNMN